MNVSRAVLALLVLLGATVPASAQVSFKRADSNSDGTLNISDPIHVLTFLFVGGPGGPAPLCRDAADAKDDGTIDISDGLWSLSFLFVGGPAPPAPFPNCGIDPTEDALDCQSYSQCPQVPTFPHPDPDPCGQIGGPCESALIGPYTMVSTPDDTGVFTTATHRDGEVFLLRWNPVTDKAVDLILSMPGSSPLDPFRIEAGLPTLQGANLLAGLVLLLNTSEPAQVKAAAAARQPSSNHAGCDPQGLMGWADCSPFGKCCDLHDACIYEECTGPDDSGDLRECARRFPQCSPRCTGCHLLVIACFALSVEFPLFAPGPSQCCDRGDCGLPQQCITGGVVETNPDRCPQGHGDGWGDVHLITFDRLAYDFQGVGEFVMARSLAADLEVQARTAPWRNSRHVSVTKAAAMNVEGDRVAVYLDRSPALYVNGAPAVLGCPTTPASERRSGPAWRRHVLRSVV